MKRKRLGMLMAVILTALIFCWVPADAFALGRPDVSSPDAAVGAGALASPVASPRGYQDYKDWPVIATIEQVGDNADETVEFTLDECTAIRIYAIGEGAESGMDDYGSIENAATGQIVWQMYYFETERGGGAYYKNRRVDRGISLPAGTYRLHFRTNDTHSFEDWGNHPPDDGFWGITLYQDISGENRGACWERARPEDLGWSSGKLNEIIPELERMNCAALMIVTDGRVVFEWGNTANNFFAHSVRKSLLSGLYGIYVAEGKIDLSKTLAELGIDDKVPLTEEEKRATVADLIKARSGVYIPAAGEAPSMKASRPERGSHAPGTFWYYNNWDFNALGTIFDQETGEKNIYEAFQARIADPIGMQDLAIENLRYTYEPYSMHPYYGMRISARDLARFGQLFLQGGEWNGLQIIPTEWVEESTYPHSLTGSRGTYSGYGYMWWIAAEDSWSIKKGSYAASGYGGHTLEVLPDLNTVIVFRINTDDPSVELTGGAAVDQLVVKILRASTDADDAYDMINRAVAIWAALVLAAVVVLLWDLMRGRPGSWGVQLAWVLVTVLYGPLGLLAYWFAGRQSGRTPEQPVSPWWRALGAAMYGVTAYTIGWILLMAIFFHLWPARSPVVTLVLTYSVPFALGLLLFRALPLAARLGGRYGLALRRGALAEIISFNLALAGMFPTGVFLVDRWVLSSLEIVSLPFWGIAMMVALAGVVVVYIYQVWLAHRGFWLWPARLQNPGGREGERVAVPSLRNAWGALLLSVAVLIVSVVLMVLFLV